VLPDGYKYTGSYLTILYFIMVTTIGTYIIMTLFIVILLERFAGQDDSTYKSYQHCPHVVSVPRSPLSFCGVDLSSQV
jgi:hypothetical protein